MTPPVYEPTNLVGTVVALLFYLIMAGFIIYSLIAIYSLLRYSRNRILALTVAILYLIISSGLYVAAISNLSQI